MLGKALLIILGVFLAILLSPQIATLGHRDEAIVQAPAQFVRKQILDYNFMLKLQKEGLSGSLDAMRLDQNGKMLPAIKAHKREYLELTDSDGSIRSAKVFYNSFNRFIYRESFAWGQRVIHIIQFQATGKKEGMETKLSHERIWKGSLAALTLWSYWPAARIWLGDEMSPPTRNEMGDIAEALRKALESQ